MKRTYVYVILIFVHKLCCNNLTEKYLEYPIHKN